MLLILKLNGRTSRQPPFSPDNTYRASIYLTKSWMSMGGGRVDATNSRLDRRERPVCLSWRMVMPVKLICTCERFLVARVCMPLLATFLMASSILERSKGYFESLYLS